MNRPEQTFAHAEKIALTLRELGINFNLAPVVDLDAGFGQPGYFRQGEEVLRGSAVSWCGMPWSLPGRTAGMES